MENLQLVGVHNHMHKSPATLCYWLVKGYPTTDLTCTRNTLYLNCCTLELHCP